jgi:ribosomal protein S27AE
MYWLKACPRCRGDLVQVAELDDYRVSCLQCGLALTREQEKALPRHSPPPPSVEDTSALFWKRALAPRAQKPARATTPARHSSLSRSA